MPAWSALPAQGTSLVQPGDLAYRDIDRLVELGLLDSVIVGQRPYSRREVARLVRIARDRLDLDAGSASASDRAARIERTADRTLRHLEDRFGDEASGRTPGYPLISLVDGLALIFSSTNAARRPFPADYTRPIEALIDPLAQPRLAQPPLRGNTTDLELSQRIEPAPWISFYGRERIEYRAPLDTVTGKSRGELLIAGMRLRYRNVALGVGRLPMAWSQNAGDGLFFASTAPALDMITLQNDEPLVPLGPFRFLGPVKGTLVLADMGPSAVRNSSKLLAYKVSAAPTSSLEVGATFMDHFGGQGGRQSARIDQVIDFLPFIDIFRRHNYLDSTRTLDVDSDKMLGTDARLRLDRLGGMTIAGELLIDDFDVHSLQRMLTGYGSQTVRVIFPSVGSSGVALRFGAKHMGTITYSHPALSGGFASRGRLLGDELGPDAKEFSTDLRWSPADAGVFTLEAREQVYSNATYGFRYTDPQMVQTDYFKLTSTPDERRHILVGSLVLRPDADLSLTLRVGGQVVENYAFAGYQRTDYVAGIALRLRQ